MLHLVITIVITMAGGAIGGFLVTRHLEIKQAARCIHRDALVSEVSRLSMRPGDKLVVKVRDLSQDRCKRIEAALNPHFPDTKILVCDGDTELSVVEVHLAAPEGSEA